MEVEIEEYGDQTATRTVYITEDDKCSSCNARYGCPLIECLSNGLVIPTTDIKVVDCEHFI